MGEEEVKAETREVLKEENYERIHQGEGRSSRGNTANRRLGKEKT